MRPVTRRYRERATGISEERYEQTRKHMKIGTTISSLGIPFAIAGSVNHEPRPLNIIAAAVTVGATFMGCYLLRKVEEKRHEKMMLFLRKDAAEGNVTAAEELHFYIEPNRGHVGS